MCTRESGWIQPDEDPAVGCLTSGRLFKLRADAEEDDDVRGTDTEAPKGSPNSLKASCVGHVSDKSVTDVNAPVVVSNFSEVGHRSFNLDKAHKFEIIIFFPLRAGNPIAHLYAIAVQRDMTFYREKTRENWLSQVVYEAQLLQPLHTEALLKVQAV